MRSKNHELQHIRQGSRSRNRHRRSGTNSVGSTDSSPSSNSTDRRVSRNGSSTSDLWNAFAPPLGPALGQRMPDRGPFTGQFIHPDYPQHYHHQPHYYNRGHCEHVCDHCVVGSQRQHMHAYGDCPEIYDRGGYMKPANHHPYMADETLIYQGIAPPHPGSSGDGSYQSDYMGYRPRHMPTFESLPDTNHMEYRQDIHSVPPHYFQPHQTPYQGYLPGLERSASQTAFPPQPHRPITHLPQHPGYPLQYNPNYHYQYGPVIHNHMHAQYGYRVPYTMNHQAPYKSHSQGHMPAHLGYYDLSRGNTGHRRSPSPEVDRRRSSSEDEEEEEESRLRKERKEKKRKYREEQEREEEEEEEKKRKGLETEKKTRLSLKFQKQLTQKSNFVHRQNTHLSGVASPLFNGPPPRRVFAYADPNIHGLTPHPSSRIVVDDNYGQPAWFRHDSFGESPGPRDSKKQDAFNFSGIISPMQLSPENDDEHRGRYNHQNTFNKMTKQHSPCHESGEKNSKRNRSVSASPQK